MHHEEVDGATVHTLRFQQLGSRGNSGSRGMQAAPTDLRLDLKDLTPSAGLQVGVGIQSVFDCAHHMLVGLW